MHLLLNDSISYAGVGDRLDAVCVAKMLYDTYQEPVKFHMLRGIWPDFRKFIDLYEMEASLVLGIKPTENFIKHDAKGKDQIELFNKYGDFPKIQAQDFSDKFDLPKKFVTVQFDAKQSRTSLSKTELNRITNYYSSQGYELIHVGGGANNDLLLGKTDNIKHIVYVMSKADLHIGAESGMCVLARQVMPTENVHIYTSDMTDFKSSIVCRTEEKGAKVNYSR